MNKSLMEHISQEKIIVIARNVKNEQIIDLAKALNIGGIKFLEVTFDKSGRFSDEYVAKEIELLSKTMGDSIFVGAGTVMSAKQVELACEAGAKYIISPNVHHHVIKRTKELGMISIPGAMTPTEIQNAVDFGADIAKLFPAGDLGLNYIKSLIAPLSDVKMMCVGGIDEKNISSFLNLGICGVGVGSNIVKQDLLKKNDYGSISKLAEIYTRQIKEAF